MSFPESSETFASNDVRALADNGTDIAVHSLRAAHQHTCRLLVERGLESIPVTHSSGVATVTRGILMGVQHPHAFASVLWLVLRTCLLVPGHLGRSLLLVPRVLEIYGQLREERPDVVHAYWAHYPSLVLYLVQRFMPEVVTSISFSAYDIHYRYRATGPVARRADLIRSLSTATAEESARAFGLEDRPVEVIHDSVDMSLVPDPMQRVPRRIVTAGRLVRAKGMDLVLRAFRDVHRLFPDSTLRVLGSGPERERLVALAAELGVSQAIDFVGHVSQANVLIEMRQAEAFVFLSLSERLPNVVKEAMVCGCVCIVSRTPGIEELIHDGVTGYVVEQGDVDAAVERMTAVFRGDVRVDTMIATAESRIRTDFELRANVGRYLRLWRSRLRQRSGR